MAVKTTISEKDFPTILANYDLGEYRSFETFANGAGQTTILLETDKGKFVLRYYENRTDKHVQFEVKLFDFLRSKSYPVPLVIKNSSDEFSSKYKGKPYIIIEFVEGVHGKNPNDSFDEAEAGEVIKAVAQLHKLTENNRLEFFKSREVFDIDYCLGEYHKQSRTKDKDKRENWLKKELEKLELPDTMPKGLCHADLNYGNFIFRDGKIVAVLDFDMSFYYYLVYDIASLIYWWALPPEKDFQEREAAFIISEYAKHRELSEEERLHIFDALKLIVLLGISWSEEGDFENEKTKIELLNSIGRHNLEGILKK
jgi:Ser/Thr protein kinase RdoA (MazF antagonist)